jgi:hypothetical protein
VIEFPVRARRADQRVTGYAPSSADFGTQAYREGVNNGRVVHSITTAAQAHSDDLDIRIRRYLISMGIRTVCLILVVVIHSPVRWVFGVLAVILPYIAVVMANAAGHRRGTGSGPVPVSRRTLSGSADEKPAGTQASPEQSRPQSDEWTA